MVRRFAAVALVVACGAAVLVAGRSGSADAATRDAGRAISLTPRVDGGYNLMYQSVGVGGRLIEETAILWLPSGARSGNVVAWAHATKGLADQCAPSRTHEGEIPSKEALLAAGDVLVAPDFEGLGAGGVHPYLVGVSEGRSVLDAIRAARAVTGADGRSAVYGWSQGGHAALFAARIARSYAPDAQLAGAAALAPVTATTSMVDGSTWLSSLPGMVAMVTAGYVEAYPELDANDMLDQPARQLDVARSDCDAGTNLTGTTTRLPNAAWRKRLRQNDPAISKIGLPVLLTHGKGDFLLGTSDVESTYRRLCRQGSTVQFDFYEGADHLTVLSASTFDVFFWLQDRLAGIPTTGCERRLIPA